MDLTDPLAGTAPRVPTGVNGLDTLLRGGWLHGGTYIVTGMPGAGKTILANQFCFSAVAAGGRAVYVTVLAESHERMVLHLGPLRFFQRDAVGRAIHYVSGYGTLKSEGLAGLGRLIFHAVREHEATTLVVDGLSAVEEHAESRLAFREFLHGLCVHNAMAACTTLLLTGHKEDAGDPQFAMVDGVIDLTLERHGQRAVRTLEVAKFRGGAQLAGKHTFDITDDGILIYPRTEALYAKETPVVPDARVRLPFGVARLDEMLSGGVVRYSSTLLFGSPGSGKTLLGLHFLHEGARRGEPGLYFGFVETGPRAINKAAAVGLDLTPHVKSGALRLEWRMAAETLPDALVHDLLGLVERHRIQRLFLDGLEPFSHPALDPDRIPRFLTAVVHELRARGVSLVATQQTHALFGPELSSTLVGVDAILDNIVLLRFVELRSQLYRMLSVLKMRESDNDAALRLFTISARGIDVAETFESAEDILTGRAHPVPPGGRKKVRKKQAPGRRRGPPQRRKERA